MGYPTSGCVHRGFNDNVLGGGVLHRDVSIGGSMIMSWGGGGGGGGLHRDVSRGGSMVMSQGGCPTSTEGVQW